MLTIRRSFITIAAGVAVDDPRNWTPGRAPGPGRGPGPDTRPPNWLRNPA